MLDPLIRQFGYKLHPRYRSYRLNDLLQIVIAHDIIFHQPEKIEVLEFR